MTGWPDPGTPTAEVAHRYALTPLPGEGGLWGSGPRTGALSSIRFLLTDEEDGFSALHRLALTEGWQWLAGAPADLVELDRFGSVHTTTLDADTSQVVVPPLTWIGARTTGAWTLVACWCAPAFEFAAFELAGRADLMSVHPGHAELIKTYTSPRRR